MPVPLEQQAQVIAEISETFLTMESLAKLGSDSMISPERAIQLAPELIRTVESNRRLQTVDLTVEQVAAIILITQEIIDLELSEPLKYRNFRIKELLSKRS